MLPEHQVGKELSAGCVCLALTDLDHALMPLERWRIRDTGVCARVSST